MSARATVHSWLRHWVNQQLEVFATAMLWPVKTRLHQRPTT